MTDHTRAPSGLGRRARRLSDQETERRMLAAAVAMVQRTGLTVSLDHISFEDVIRDADVARSAVYRRWPYKDLFFSDLVKELAKEAIPPTIISDDYELTRLARSSGVSSQSRCPATTRRISSYSSSRRAGGMASLASSLTRSLKNRSL